MRVRGFSKAFLFRMGFFVLLSGGARGLSSETFLFPPPLIYLLCSTIGIS